MEEDLDQYARNYLQGIIDELNEKKIHRHKKNKILLIPMDGTGHVYGMLGLAHYLLQRYHSPVFVVSTVFANKYLENTPYKVRTFVDPNFEGCDSPQKRWAINVLKNSAHFRKYPENQLDLQEIFYNDFVKTVTDVNDAIAQIIKEEKPELILVDYYVSVPAVIGSGIPWGCVVSANPLCVYRDFNGPPMYSGFGFGASKSKWKAFREAFKEKMKKPNEILASFARERGVSLPEGELWTPSKTINLYIYPAELDYTEVSKKIPMYWTRVDHFIRPHQGIPLGFDMTGLKDGVRKVYFTLGSMGSADVILMDRLLKVLEKTPYQYIVSLGPNHEKLKLPPNAVGGKFINQLAVIPMVDLVICHGGNNTFIESLYHGKPMVIFPLFGDQFDNATRIVDRWLGYAFCPYTVKAHELYVAMADLINDIRVNQDLKKISHRMRRSRAAQRTVVALETVMAEIPEC